MASKFPIDVYVTGLNVEMEFLLKMRFASCSEYFEKVRLLSLQLLKSSPGVFTFLKQNFHFPLGGFHLSEDDF